MATNNHKYVFDAALEMRDAGLITASAASLVDGAAKILDLGASYCEGDLVIDVTVVEVATGNEKLEIEWQLSNSATFGSGNVCATVVKIGDSTVNGSSADSTTGRYVQPVHNEFNGTIYRYARLYERYTGTIDTGYNFSAFLSKR
jgi:hypothetical protein